MEQFAKEPRGFIELLKHIALVWWSNLSTTLPYALLFSLVYMSNNTLFDPVARYHFYNNFSFLKAMLLVLWVVAMIYALTLLYQALHRRMQGQSVGYGELVQNSLYALPRVLWVFFLYTLFVTLGILCFVIPGIYLSIAIWFAVPLCMIFPISAIFSIKVSLLTISNNWWRCLAVYILFMGTMVLLSHALLTVYNKLDIAWWLYLSFQLILNLIHLSLSACVSLVLLNELQVRNPNALAILKPGSMSE